MGLRGGDETSAGDHSDSTDWDMIFFFSDGRWEESKSEIQWRRIDEGERDESRLGDGGVPGFGLGWMSITQPVSGKIPGHGVPAVWKVSGGGEGTGNPGLVGERNGKIEGER